MLMGGQGISGSSAIVPPAQNPNSIADGGSVSLNLQPTPMTGSTVTKSPGNGPAVAGPSVGTRVPVTISASYSKDILPVVNTVVREAKSAIEFIKKKLVTDK
jgi:hypothetical protein